MSKGSAEQVHTNYVVHWLRHATSRMIAEEGGFDAVISDLWTRIGTLDYEGMQDWEDEHLPQVRRLKWSELAGSKLDIAATIKAVVAEEAARRRPNVKAKKRNNKKRIPLPTDEYRRVGRTYDPKRAEQAVLAIIKLRGKVTPRTLELTTMMSSSWCSTTLRRLAEKGLIVWVADNTYKLSAS